MYISEEERAGRWWDNLSMLDQEEYKKEVKHHITEEIKEFLDIKDIILLYYKYGDNN